MDRHGDVCRDRALAREAIVQTRKLLRRIGRPRDLSDDVNDGGHLS
jgi:hypothetical protein